MARIGINGFGRIGRYLVRLMAERNEFPVVINARADNASLAHLFKYDSVHHTFKGTVGHDENGIIINGTHIAVTRCKPNEWQWKDYGVDLVVESTGTIKKRAGLAEHMACGAKKVIMSAPVSDADITIVMGVNDGLYDPAKHDVVSSASCTTNCLAPVAKVLNDTFGIEHGLMTTIHSYTMSQRILDGSQKDIRRARAAAMSMIPTTTGAAKAVALVLPELKGKLDGIAVGAEVNQNAFSNILVGSTSIAADTKTDTLTFVAGTNVTLTPDAANDKLTIAAKDTTYAAATQSVAGLMSAADKKSVDYCEALRLSMIGVPRYWRSTTLPANHVWANGDLVLFSDWPELKKVYDGGGFTGMLLAYNATSATIAANLGKWRPNAANTTGLYVPKLSDQFFRAWTGTGREAGSWMTDTGRTIQGMVNYDHLAPMETTGVFSTAPGDGNGYNMSVTSQNHGPTNFTIDSALMWGSDHVGSAFAPEHVLLPVILYLGLHT